MHLRKYRPWREKSHMQTVNWSQSHWAKHFMTFTDTVQSSVWEQLLQKSGSADILGGEKLHFPVPHLLAVLCIVTERNYTWNYISSLLKNNSRQNSNTFKEEKNIILSNLFRNFREIHSQLQIKNTVKVKAITYSHKFPSGRIHSYL